MNQSLFKIETKNKITITEFLIPISYKQIYIVNLFGFIYRMIQYIYEFLTDIQTNRYKFLLNPSNTFFFFSVNFS